MLENKKGIPRKVNPATEKRNVNLVQKNTNKEDGVQMSVWSANYKPREGGRDDEAWRVRCRRDSEDFYGRVSGES